MAQLTIKFENEKLKDHFVEWFDNRGGKLGFGLPTNRTVVVWSRDGSALVASTEPNPRFADGKNADQMDKEDWA